MSSILRVWQPSEAEPWDLARVAHLHRRAGFAPDWATIQHSLALGVGATIERILPGPAGQTGRGTLAADPEPSRTTAKDRDFEQLAGVIGEAAVGADSSDRLRAWWVYRMLMTPNPLIERMTLLWHNHFATSNDKVDDVAAMFEQNNLLRKHSLGSFRDLLPAVVKHRAMLKWLDAAANRKEHPNENLARELMELFTLGEGNYGERDVTEAARCLTGWTYRGTQFRFVPENHDTGEKTVLGHTSDMDGDALIDLLLEHPATARRIARRLCQMFFGDGVVDEPAQSALAEGIRQNDLNVGWGVETILRSELFFSEANLRSRVASPVEYVIGAARLLGMQDKPPSTLLLGAELRNLGQDLFHPPNVFGWPEGRGWINTRSIIARAKLASRLMAGKLHRGGTPVEVERLAKACGMGGSRDQIVEFYTMLIVNESQSKREDRPRNGNASSASQSPVRHVVERMLASPQNQLA